MYVRKNLLKEKVKNGRLVIGLEIWLRNPRVIEIAGQAGFDFAHIENEHVAHDWETVESLVRAAELAGLTPLFRTEQCIAGQPPVNQIVKALKCGAQIIMVPHVDTPEAARKIVEAAKFPPNGKRGFVTYDRSATEFFPNETAPLDLQRFIREANEETMLWVLIESPEGVKNVDAILDVDGIDAVGFGYQDYAIAIGLSTFSGAELERARERVREAAERKGKPMWRYTLDPKSVEEERRKGARIFVMGGDIIHLNSLLRSMNREIRGLG